VWSRAYRDGGLVVIGVHTPEFSFEHEIDRVRQATKERGIDYPVAVDNDYEIWTAFENHYWPALYFVDADGITRDHHFGEGRYEQSERIIQRLIGVERELVSAVGLGVEAEADWDHLRTPETYLGYGRSEHFASPDGAAFDERRAYQLPERLRIGHWALAGEWTIRRGNVVLDQAGGSIAYRFHARDAHLVLFGAAREPIPFRLLLDGEAPGPSHGVDVDEDGNGILRDGRLYQVVRQHDAVRERTLQTTFLEPGGEADPWVKPGNLGSTVNTSDAETRASLSGTGMTLVFGSNRSGSELTPDVTSRSRHLPHHPPARAAMIASHAAAGSSSGLASDGTQRVRLGTGSAIDIDIAKIGPPLRNRHHARLYQLQAIKVPSNLLGTAGSHLGFAELIPVS